MSVKQDEDRRGVTTINEYNELRGGRSVTQTEERSSNGTYSLAVEKNKSQSGCQEKYIHTYIHT